MNTHTPLPSPPSYPPLVDSHCHLDFFLDKNSRSPNLPNLPNLSSVLENAANANISILLSIATSLTQQQNILNLCSTHSTQKLRIFCSAGTHPTYLSSETPPPTTQQLLAWKEQHNEQKHVQGQGQGQDHVQGHVQNHVQDHVQDHVIAFGESGLDFFRPNHPPAALQETSFRNHILASQEAQIPLVVHNRAADQDIERILCKTQKERPYPCILHCFAASQRLADVARETGCILSFAGLVTYRNTQHLVPIVRSTPLSALLLETDSPFLPPQEPTRNKRPPYAEPAMLPVTANHIAFLKDLSLHEVAEQTTQTFFKTFKIPPDQHDEPEKAREHAT